VQAQLKPRRWFEPSRAPAFAAPATGARLTLAPVSVPRRPPRRPSPDRAIDVGLAEFETLRAEIVSHLSAQAAVVGLGLTALGVIIGFSVKEGGSERLLLAIPPLTLLVVLLHAASSYRLALIGKYIRKELWPYLARQAGDPKLPSWEGRVGERQRSWKSIPLSLVVDFPAMAIFILGSIVALLRVGGCDVFVLVGWASVVAAIVLPSLVGLKARALAHS
jgi:hypothetical protein